MAAVAAAACGASYQAVYEGDVRFERCMALDAHPDVKPTIRRACWLEWVAHYTYGQTRDRVNHALTRIRHLSGISDEVTEGAAEDGSDEGPMSLGPVGSEPGGAGPASPAFSHETGPKPSVGPKADSGGASAASGSNR